MRRLLMTTTALVTAALTLTSCGSEPKPTAAKTPSVTASGSSATKKIGLDVFVQHLAAAQSCAELQAAGEQDAKTLNPRSEATLATRTYEREIEALKPVWEGRISDLHCQAWGDPKTGKTTLKSTLMDGLAQEDWKWHPWHSSDDETRDGYAFTVKIRSSEVKVVENTDAAADCFKGTLDENSVVYGFTVQTQAVFKETNGFTWPQDRMVGFRFQPPVASYCVISGKDAGENVGSVSSPGAFTTNMVMGPGQTTQQWVFLKVGAKSPNNPDGLPVDDLGNQYRWVPGGWAYMDDAAGGTYSFETGKYEK